MAKHVGMLVHSTEGAALCFLAYCQEGASLLGAHVYPDVTIDYIAFGHSMPAWDAGDYDSVRATLSRSVDRLARAGSPRRPGAAARSGPDRPPSAG